MTKTKKLDMELPKEGRFISSEFPILRENLTKLDQALITVEESIEGKAPSKHTHTISDVTGLESALHGKMAANKTFTFADLSDIEGAKDAANNYVLYKSGNNNFTFGSAVSLLGAHKHKTEDIVGLDDFRAKINEDLTSYGRLKQANEWQNDNKFTSKVTMSGGLKIVDNSPFKASSSMSGGLEIVKNSSFRTSPLVGSSAVSIELKRSFSVLESVVTRLSANGSMLKGPLTVDGDVVYTKAQVDAAILAEIKSLKKDLIDKITNWPALADAELLYTQNGKIEWPDWVTDKTKVEITAWGGGGGGGGAYYDYLGGGGGGGGCSVWYGYKASLNGHENIIIGKGGTSVARHGMTGNSGGITTIGKDFITATGGKGGGGAYYYNSSNYSSGSGGVGGVGGNFGLATDEHPGLAKGGNGYAGTRGITSKTSGCGGDAGGDTSRGGSGGIGQGSYSSGKAGRGFGGGGAGSHGDNSPSGAGADGAVLIRLWKD
ncbi:phage tail repeat domain-containing protein [Bartonella krasnovii]|uniref:Bgr_08870 family protein n=1 Tax=Bartonella krasnovii TaxID=2267275 RepID=UPI001F4C6C31|nr:Bgr_08870 family protein [Bartonella krasnovii]UNF42933.1 phage tail repeat domain-containing protein [Bartonella krasnovii]UNF56142.1 phage tail repeat domain-containing protein [Bartonella krasnovii]